MRWVSGAVSESSIAIDIGTVRGAAVYALEKLGHTTCAPTRTKCVRHDPGTAASHRERQNRQAAMEQLLNSPVG